MIDLAFFTQIGGKYSKANASLFRVKHKLQNIGVVVHHPIGDELVGFGANFVAFDPRSLSLADVERDYYRCIRKNSFHTVANNLEGQPGYLGLSAAVELCYAIVCARPCWIIYPPSYTFEVSQVLRQIIDNNIGQIFCCHEDMPDEELSSRLAHLACSDISYSISLDEEIAVYEHVKMLIESIS